MIKKKRERVRICLDCNKMMHDRNEWECGRCLYDGHKIDHINNHDWCKHWWCESFDAKEFDYSGDLNSDVDI